MNTLKMVAAVAVSVWVCGVVGCAAPTADDEQPEAVASDEAELKSAECPMHVEVTIAKPTIMSDAKLVATWTKDFDVGYGDPKPEAEQQLTTLTTQLAAARSEGAVTLKGTLGAACFYSTVDATTGKRNGYSLWFAKSGGPKGQLQLRVSRDLGDPDSLFFNAPVKTLSPSALKLAAGTEARVYAKHVVPEYHGEPGGTNAWIGFADVTAKLTY